MEVEEGDAFKAFLGSVTVKANKTAMSIPGIPLTKYDNLQVCSKNVVSVIYVPTANDEPYPMYIPKSRFFYKLKCCRLTNF